MRFLDLLFPPRCLSCRAFKPDGDLCDSCRGDFPALLPPCCTICAISFEAGNGHLCSRCLKEPPPFVKTFSLGIYKGILHDLIGRMKFQGEERIGVLLGRWMARSFFAGKDVDLILPVPLGSSRLRMRGFNQSVLLGREVAKACGLPLDPFVLERMRDTPPQTGLPAAERKKNLKGAFRLNESGRVRGRKILLIDDVYTTGATVSECARVLRKAGAASICVAVAARTP